MAGLLAFLQNDEIVSNERKANINEPTACRGLVVRTFTSSLKGFGFNPSCHQFFFNITSTFLFL